MKRQDFPTMFDKVYASCFVDDQNDAFFSPSELRQRIFSSRRFTCDDGMSGMIGDIASLAFSAKTAKARYRAIEAMRTGARLPHKRTWVEYNLKEAHLHLRKYLATTPDGGPLAPIEEIPRGEGWMIEQHESIETAFRATVYVSDDKIDFAGYDTWAFPWAFCWRTDDGPLPWNVERLQTDDGEELSMSSLVVGLVGYHCPNVGVQLSDVARRSSPKQQKQVFDLLTEWAGVVRRMWAFLSTINDLPVEFKEVKPSKGYMAKRNYRKFLEHKIITLSVPQSEYKKIARSAVAKARRRAHMVRGHWRRDYRHPGQKLWVHEHQRGDASIGFVTHDYAVTHNTKETQ